MNRPSIKNFLSTFANIAQLSGFSIKDLPLTSVITVAPIVPKLIHDIMNNIHSEYFNYLLYFIITFYAFARIALLTKKVKQCENNISDLLLNNGSINQTLITELNDKFQKELSKNNQSLNLLNRLNHLRWLHGNSGNSLNSSSEVYPIYITDLPNKFSQEELQLMLKDDILIEYERNWMIKLGMLKNYKIQ